MSLFPHTPGYPIEKRTPEGALLLAEFKAGQLVRDGKLMKPDTRKGKLQAVRTEDQLVHVQWVDRTSGALVEDLIVFPEEAKLEEMPMPRCYVLKFQQVSFFGSDLERFEPKTSDLVDKQLVQELNEAIGASTDVDMSTAVAESASLVSHAITEDMDAAVGATPAPAAPQLNQLPTPGASLVTPAAGLADTATPAAPVADRSRSSVSAIETPTGGVQASDLRAIMAGLGQTPVPSQTPSSVGGAGAGAGRIDASILAGALGSALQSAMDGSGGRGGRMVAPGPSLSDLLKPEELLTRFSTPGMLEKLAEYMPEEHRNEGQLCELAHSPQFLQQIESFSKALQTGQIDLMQFGLDPNTGYTVAEFLEAIEKKVASEQA